MVHAIGLRCILHHVLLDKLEFYCTNEMNTYLYKCLRKEEVGKEKEKDRDKKRQRNRHIDREIDTERHRNTENKRIGERVQRVIMPLCVHNLFVLPGLIYTTII